MSESAIVQGLQTGVTAAVAASTAPDLPVKYVLVGSDAGAAFVPPADQKYLEIVWLPNNRTSDFLGNEKNHRGILRLVLHWPNDGSGAYDALDLMDSIGAYFYKGRLLSGVQVYATADPTGFITQDSEVLLPVSILYQSYRKGLEP